MFHDRPAAGPWLAYIEASRLLAVFPGAVRGPSRREKRAGPPPQALGEPRGGVLPADRVRPGAANGHDQADQRSTMVTANGHDQSDERSTGHDDSVREAIKSLGEAVSSLGAQLLRERERADRAEGRVRELDAERIELHRQIATLTAQATARRAWWPWRR